MEFQLLIKLLIKKVFSCFQTLSCCFYHANKCLWFYPTTSFNLLIIDHDHWMLDSVYYLTLKMLWDHIFCVKVSSLSSKCGNAFSIIVKEQPDMGLLCLPNNLSQYMRFPTMWYVRPAKPQISLRIPAVWSEPLLVAWVFYDCSATDWTPFGVSKLKEGCRGSSESTLVKMSNCWKSHAGAHFILHMQSDNQMDLFFWIKI